MSTPDLAPRLRVLGTSRVFAALPAEALAALAAAMTEREFGCGGAIFSQSDAGRSLFAVLAGEVRILFAAADGREHVLRHVGAGEIFGEIGVLDGKPRSANAIAATRCRLLVLDRSSLLALIAAQPEAALQLMTTLCERLRAASAQIEDLVFHPLPKRLACALLSRMSGRKAASIDVTQSELGRLTGVTRETVNKRLRAWQAEGVVSLSPGRITILDVCQLQELSTAA
jgi:CRP-like cAMP-binding protein